MVIFIVTTLLGSPSFDVGWLMVAMLMALAVVPVVVALGVTLWAATRPSAPPGKA